MKKTVANIYFCDFRIEVRLSQSEVNILHCIHFRYLQRISITEAQTEFEDYYFKMQ